MAIHGFPFTRGVGPLSITAGGFMILFTDGYGYRVINGRLPGSVGAMVTVFTDGRRSGLSLSSV